MKICHTKKVLSVSISQQCVASAPKLSESTGDRLTKHIQAKFKQMEADIFGCKNYDLSF